MVFEPVTLDLWLQLEQANPTAKTLCAGALSLPIPVKAGIGLRRAGLSKLSSTALQPRHLSLWKQVRVHRCLLRKLNLLLCLKLALVRLQARLPRPPPPRTFPCPLFPSDSDHRMHLEFWIVKVAMNAFSRIMLVLSSIRQSRLGQSHLR